MQNDTKKFVNNVSWLMSGKIVNMLLQFFVSLATARYLGPYNFGTINYVAAFVSFFSSIASLGLAVIVIKEVATDRYDNNTVIWTSIWMRLGVAILSTISLILLMFITDKQDENIVIIAALESISIIFSAFDTFNYYFQAKLMSKWSSIAGVLAYLGMSLYRIYLLLVKADIIWFAFSTSADMIFLTAFLLVFYVKEHGFHPRFDWNIGKKLLGQSRYYMIAGLIMIVYGQIDRVMLGNMMGNEEVGLYSAALTIASLWSLIPSSLTQSISPVLYKAAKTDRVLYLRRLRQSYAIIFWMNALYSIGCTVFSKWIIILLYGEDYLAASGALAVVVWYYGISSMSTLNQIYLANDGINRYINRFCGIGVVVNLVLNALMIPWCGIVGAAMATLITHIIIQIALPLSYKETREMGRTILQGACLCDVVNEQEWQEIKLFAKKIIKSRRR